MDFSIQIKSLGNLHASYGKSVGKHFPLWVSLYTALAATTTFFFLLGMKRWDVSLGPLQKIFQPLQDRLGSTHCVVSSLAGCALGGTTLFLASLPAWGKGHPAFSCQFCPSHLSKRFSSTWVGAVFNIPYPRQWAESKSFSVRMLGRIAYAVQGVIFPILGVLDLTVGLLALPCVVVTGGQHQGSKAVAKQCLLGGVGALPLSLICLAAAILPHKKIGSLIERKKLKSLPRLSTRN